MAALIGLLEKEIKWQSLWVYLIAQEGQSVWGSKLFCDFRNNAELENKLSRLFQNRGKPHPQNSLPLFSLAFWMPAMPSSPTGWLTPFLKSFHKPNAVFGLPSGLSLVLCLCFKTMLCNGGGESISEEMSALPSWVHGLGWVHLFWHPVEDWHLRFQAVVRSLREN